MPGHGHRQSLSFTTSIDPNALNIIEDYAGSPPLPGELGAESGIDSGASAGAAALPPSPGRDGGAGAAAVVAGAAAGAAALVGKSGVSLARLRGLASSTEPVSPAAAAAAAAVATAAQAAAESGLSEVEAEVFEFERIQPFRGWGHTWPGHFLPSDRVGHWGDRSGAPGGAAAALFDKVAPRCPPGWEWREAEWRVDYSPLESEGVDADGWAYSMDFALGTWPPVQGSGRYHLQKFVRSRRWVRTRVRAGSSAELLPLSGRSTPTARAGTPKSRAGTPSAGRAAAAAAEVGQAAGMGDGASEVSGDPAAQAAGDGGSQGERLLAPTAGSANRAAGGSAGMGAGGDNIGGSPAVVVGGAAAAAAAVAAAAAAFTYGAGAEAPPPLVAGTAPVPAPGEEVQAAAGAVAVDDAVPLLPLSAAASEVSLAALDTSAAPEEAPLPPLQPPAVSVLSTAVPELAPAPLLARAPSHPLDDDMSAPAPAVMPFVPGSSPAPDAAAAAGGSGLLDPSWIDDVALQGQALPPLRPHPSASQDSEG